MLCNLWTVARQAPLSMGFSTKKMLCGLPCYPPGDLPNPGIKLKSPASPALQADSLRLSHPLYVIDAQKILVERMNTTLTMMWKPFHSSFISHDSFRPQGAIIFHINTSCPSLSPVSLLFPCGGMIVPYLPLDNSPSPLKTQFWLYLCPWCPCDNNPPCIELSFCFLPR